MLLLWIHSDLGILLKGNLVLDQGLNRRLNVGEPHTFWVLRKKCFTSRVNVEWKEQHMSLFFPPTQDGHILWVFYLYWQGLVKALWQMSWFKEAASVHLQYFTVRDDLVFDGKVVRKEEKATSSQQWVKVGIVNTAQMPMTLRLCLTLLPRKFVTNLQFLWCQPADF